MAASKTYGGLVGSCAIFFSLRTFHSSQPWTWDWSLQDDQSTHSLLKMLIPDFLANQRPCWLPFCPRRMAIRFSNSVSCPYYCVQGEMNGHRGLVPSNFLEEVPDDVEVYLTDTPSHYPQDEPTNCTTANSASVVSEGKRVHHHRRCQR